MMSVVLHISDTHFGTEQPTVVEALRELCREEAPELLVFSGDVTQRARCGQFLAASVFLSRMPAAHILVVPGNHDIPLFNLVDRIFNPYRNYRLLMSDNLEPEYESPELMVLGVNTTRASRHTVGEVSPEQVERVSRRLREARGEQLRIVVTHQPVRATRESDLKNLLCGYEEAIRAWSKAGADLVLAGHIHLPHLRPLREVFNDLPRPVWSFVAGTAVSSRVRDDVPNSVNLIRYRPEERPLCCAVERWDFNERGSFLLADRQLLHLQRP